MHQLGPRSSYVRLEASGSNALDFHIAYYLGNLVISDPTAYFHIISKDTGFDPNSTSKVAENFFALAPHQ